MRSVFRSSVPLGERPSAPLGQRASADQRPLKRAGRAVSFAIGLALAGVTLTGCGGQGSDVSCSLDKCTVTFDRGVDASASLLGVDVKLKSVRDGQVTLDVGGQDVTVPVGGDAQAQAGGLTFRVDSVTDDKVVVKVSRDGA